MRKIFIASIFVFTFCAFAFGQNSNCPTISLTGPSTEEELKQPMKFKVTVTGIDPSKIQYGWSISEGEIVQGQGTDTIFVRSKPDKIEFTPTATIDMEGFPEGCQSSDSETALTICKAVSTLTDEFEISSNAIDNERLASYASEIKDNFQDQAYIFIYSDNKFSLNEIKKKEKYIRDFLARQNIPNDRFVITHSRSDKKDWGNYIRFWLVPQGADAPTP